MLNNLFHRKLNLGSKGKTANVLKHVLNVENENEMDYSSQVRAGRYRFLWPFLLLARMASGKARNKYSKTWNLDLRRNVLTIECCVGK